MTPPTCNDALAHRIAPIVARAQRLLSQIENEARNCVSDKRTIRIRAGKVFSRSLSVAWHSRLIEILDWFHQQKPGRIVVTSGYRLGDGIHGTDPLRAADLSSYEFQNPLLLQNNCNQVWSYGKEGYEVCKFHRVAECRTCKKRIKLDPEVGLTVSAVPGCPYCGASYGYLVDLGPHFHVQVRDKTRRGAL